MRTWRAASIMEHLPGRHDQKAHGRRATAAALDKLPFRPLDRLHSGMFTGMLYHGASAAQTKSIVSKGFRLGGDMTGGNYASTDPRVGARYGRYRSSRLQRGPYVTMVAMKAKGLRVASERDAKVQAAMSKVDSRISRANDRLRAKGAGKAAFDKVIMSRPKQMRTELRRSGVDALSYGEKNNLILVNPKAVKVHRIRVRPGNIGLER